MEKKATVKDVAREAGVSVATVSYIMNDRTDQKIRPETRKKVLQIANLLNYRPSHAAKSLATGRNNMIGLAYSLGGNNPSRNHEILQFAHLLIERMNRLKYDVVFIPVPESDTDSAEDPQSINHNIDAIIAMDLSHEQFHSLSNDYMVPVIAVDMLVNDNLFYQIYSDYAAVVKEVRDAIPTDCYLLLDPFSNLEYMEQITAGFPSDHILLLPDLSPDRLKELGESECIVIGSYLTTLILPYCNPRKLHVISSEKEGKWLPDGLSVTYMDVSKKANMTMNVLLNSLNRNFDIEHDLPVK